MAKKTVNSDIYNLSQLVEDVKKTFLPGESDETLAIGTYGYIGALESSRLQTQVTMTGELCNEVFPSRARLERNVITHAIMTNIENINAIPSKMTAFLAIKEADISDCFDSNNIFVVDRECPLYIGDYEFHLEYDIKLKRIYIEKKNSYTYTAQYDIPDGRDVPTSTISSVNQYLSPPAVVMVGNDSYIYLTVILSQVEHSIVSKKLVTSNIIDNKTMNFEFENQLSYFEVHVKESEEEYYLLPVFEGSSVPESKSQYYCWYQYIDSNLIRVRFDRQSYMPGLNANIECLIKTCQGAGGNFTYGQDVYVELESSNYGYKGITALLTPVTDAAGGKDRKSKKELQSLIPKEALSRGSLTTITDLNNYFGMLDSEMGRIIIQKKIDNQIERVYYTYFVAKDSNGNVIPSNTIDVKVDLDDMIKSTISETDSVRYLLPSGTCFRLGDDGVGYISKNPLPGNGYSLTPKSVTRGSIIEDTFVVEVNDEGVEKDSVSVKVDVGGSCTKTHIFPKEESERFGYDNSSKEYQVEDYIQMGCGNIYNYSAEYVTKEDNALITIRDKNLGNMDLIDASYTVNESTRHFAKVPMTAYNIPKDTKIKVNIKRRLNAKSRGIVYFDHGKNTFKLHQTAWTTNLSNMLVALGIEEGEVTDLTSSDPSIISVTEVGTIESKEPETPVIPPVTPEDPDEPITDPYKLQVIDTENLPPISERDKNQWYYAVNKHEERDGTTEGDNMGSNATADTYKLNVVNEADAPAIEDRKEDEWYYLVTKSEFRSEIPDDPEVPIEIPKELTGKEYQVEVLKGFMGQNVTLTVTISEQVYEIVASHDVFAIENGIYITEGDNETVSNVYKTFVPVLTQNKWPDELMKGDQIAYTLRYKSMSNAYAPELKIKLSEGLDYVLFSNTIKYPDGTSFNFEPTEESLAKERGFIYTNPYAVNVNSYRLYSSFYMMSMEENPYLHFDFINDKSNVQFIATNAYWTRPFSGLKKDTYTLTTTLTQSVQDDLGVIPSEENATPLVKAFAVFRRDGKDYRYRSMNLVSYDPSTYSFTFSQDFNAEDIFDNDSNIRLSNFQVVGQAEYAVTLSYNDNSYIINNGGIVKLSTILKSLGVSITGEISAVISSNPRALGVNENGNDYDVVSFTDFDGSATITISVLNEDPIVINANSTQPAVTEYGFFNPTTEVKIYTLCAIPDTDGSYSKNNFDAICPGLKNWTLTNTYDVVNGVTMYHNYSEIMGSRVVPYGRDLVKKNNTVIGVEGYTITSVPMLGYDYCQDETLVQEAINALNYRKTYIESAANLLENSFGADFKLFNTYGPSKTYYVIKDTNSNSLLDDEIEFIDRVDLSFNFRIKLVAENDSYTKGNIIQEIKEYIEDLDDIGELHIPNLITQITNNYKEQISYFEYLGFNNYGPNVQHLYKLEDNEIPIHTPPEFLNVRNVIGSDGSLTPNINVYVSEI